MTKDIVYLGSGVDATLAGDVIQLRAKYSGQTHTIYLDLESLRRLLDMVNTARSQARAQGGRDEN